MKSLKLYLFCAMAFASAFACSILYAADQPVKKEAEKPVEVKQIDDDKAFDKELKDSKVLVLVDFTASWCGPCQQLKPKIEQLAQEFKGKILFTKVEETVAPGLTQQKGIRLWPTVKLYAPGGKEVSESVGNRNIDDLRKWLQSELDAYNKSVQPKQQKKNP
ncbi:MAG: thioredoxin [Candidatus Obscuribacterales bacterium]|nr:thioredoxin [Candidatus Obscuribacterales bacterium]